MKRRGGRVIRGSQTEVHAAFLEAVDTRILRILDHFTEALTYWATCNDCTRPDRGVGRARAERSPVTVAFLPAESFPSLRTRVVSVTDGSAPRIVTPKDVGRSSPHRRRTIQIQSRRESADGAEGRRDGAAAMKEMSRVALTRADFGLVRLVLFAGEST